MISVAGGNLDTSTRIIYIYSMLSKFLDKVSCSGRDHLDSDLNQVLSSQTFVNYSRNGREWVSITGRLLVRQVL